MLLTAADMAEVFSILVLAQQSADVDDLLESLLRRPDLGLLRVATTEAALILLRDVAVSLVLVCPETNTALVTSVLGMAAELRPKAPVLLLRVRGDDAPAGWRGRRTAVLRCPVFPDVLNKTIDVALGLSPLLH